MLTPGRRDWNSAMQRSDACRYADCKHLPCAAHAGKLPAAMHHDSLYGEDVFTRHVITGCAFSRGMLTMQRLNIRTPDHVIVTAHSRL